MRKMFLFLTLSLLTFVTSCTVDKAAENLAFLKAYESTSPYEVKKFLQDYPKADAARLDSIKDRLEFVTNDSVLYTQIKNEADPRKRYELSGKYVVEFSSSPHYEEIWELYNDDIVIITQLDNITRLYDKFMKGTYYRTSERNNEKITFSEPDNNGKGIASFTHYVNGGFYNIFGLVTIAFTAKYQDFGIYFTNEGYLYAKENLEKNIEYTYEYEYEALEGNQIKLTFKDIQKKGKEHEKTIMTPPTSPNVMEITFYDDRMIIYTNGRKIRCFKYWL